MRGVRQNAPKAQEAGRNQTIDALIAQIATAYHKPLGLPRDLSSWAWQNNGKGFDIMATKVAAFLRTHSPWSPKPWLSGIHSHLR